MSPDDQAGVRPWWELPAYLLVGAFFGVVLIQSEAVSWFRIQEMFRFQGFHMYGLLATAVATSAVAIAVLKSLGRLALSGAPIALPPKRWEGGSRHRYWIGGSVFGLGWGLAGTCPGPMYALIGHGTAAAVVVLVSALIGARVYAALASRLPH
jgi:uncharacterized protein